MPKVLRTDTFADTAASLVLESARDAVAARGQFRLGLCGGSSPGPVFARLAERRAEFPAEQTLITFGDERAVPPDHPDSNFRLARTTLLDPAGIPAANVLRMQGEREPETAAAEYARLLAALAAIRSEPRYRHDLLLLGIGNDGHTASLFPGSPALDEAERDVAAAVAPSPGPARITLTFPLINAARHICFLVPDPAKREVVEAVLARDARFPASRVQPEAGTLTFLLGFP